MSVMHRGTAVQIYGFTIRKIVRVIKSLIMMQIYSQLMTSASFFGKAPFASASVDLWTSKHSNMGYAALDMQFGNPDYGISEVRTSQSSPTFFSC